MLIRKVKIATVRNESTECPGRCDKNPKVTNVMTQIWIMSKVFASSRGTNDCRPGVCVINYFVRLCLWTWPLAKSHIL